MIGEALRQAGVDILIGFGICCAVCLLGGSFMYGLYLLDRRQRERFDRCEAAIFERERREFHAAERRRSEMRCYGNARPTASERWGGRAA